MGNLSQRFTSIKAGDVFEMSNGTYFKVSEIFIERGEAMIRISENGNIPNRLLNTEQFYELLEMTGKLRRVL